jgi:hypothetical protein
MKENKDISNNKSLKNYVNIIVFSLLIFAILAIFIDKFLYKNKEEEIVKNNLGNLDHDSVNLHSLLNLQNDEKSVENNQNQANNVESLKHEDQSEIIKNDNSNIDEYRQFLSNLSIIIVNLYSEKDSSKEIDLLTEMFAQYKCPDSIKKSLESLKQYNKEFILDKQTQSNIIFPNMNNSIWKLLSPIVKIEKLDSSKNNDAKANLQKNIEYIVEYSYSTEFMQRFIKND